MTTKPGIVITYPFPLGYLNGGTTGISEYSIQFGRKGIPVYIIAVSIQFGSRFPRKVVETKNLGYELGKRLAPYGSQIIRVNPNIFHPFLDGLQVRQALKKLVSEKQIAAVFTMFNEGIFLPGFLKSMGIPHYILSFWQSYELALKLPRKTRKPVQFLSALIKRDMIQKSFQQAAHLFAISDHNARELVDHVGVNPEKITTCYLGVSEKYIELPRPKPDKIKKILFFGRIIKNKGISDAIQALGKLKAQGHDDWEYHIYGAGYLNWANSLITAENLHDHIFIHKPLYGQALRDIISQSHLALMPSHYESFGLSIAEAQAAGLPVIAYSTASVPEVIADGQTGWLASMGNIDQLATFLIQAINNPEQTYRIGLAGRERAQKLFNWEKSAETILNKISFSYNGKN